MENFINDTSTNHQDSRRLADSVDEQRTTSKAGGGGQAVDEEELKRLIEFDLLDKITQLTD